MDRELAIGVTVFTSDPEQATRAAEAFARVATGLALEGIDVSFSIHTLDEDSES